MTEYLIADGLIEKVALHSISFWLLRYDVLSFLILYLVFFMTSLSSVWHVKYAGFIGLPICFVLHLLLFLLSQWSVRLKCLIGNRKANGLTETNLIHVHSSKNAGKDTLIQLNVSNESKSDKIHMLDKSYEVSTCSFQFQKVTYNFDTRIKSFMRLQYPTSGRIASYLRWTGHKSSVDVQTSERKWGRNEFDIPLPNFLDLFLVSVAACINCLKCAICSSQYEALFISTEALLHCRTTWWRLSSCFKYCVCFCGVSTTIGTTARSPC